MERDHTGLAPGDAETEPDAGPDLVPEAEPGHRYRVSLGLTVALMAVAFAAGFAARGPGSDPVPLSPVPGSTVGPAAPALDPGQLQGGLPSGHPPINGTGVAVPAAPASGGVAPSGSPAPVPAGSASTQP